RPRGRTHQVVARRPAQADAVRAPRPQELVRGRQPLRRGRAQGAGTTGKAGGGEVTRAAVCVTKGGMRMRRTLPVLLALALLLTPAALAQTLRIGAAAAATGAASALGEPEANTFRMLQDQIN